jgi:hypothetical protein
MARPAPRGCVVGDYVPALLFAALDTDTLSAEGLLLHRLGPAWAEHRGHVRSETGPPRQPKPLQYGSDGDERHTTASTATRCTGASTSGPMPPPPPPPRSGLKWGWPGCVSPCLPLSRI